MLLSLDRGTVISCDPPGGVRGVPGEVGYSCISAPCLRLRAAIYWKNKEPKPRQSAMLKTDYVQIKILKGYVNVKVIVMYVLILHAWFKQGDHIPGFLGASGEIRYSKWGNLI